jgi:hypothetical protein
MNGREIRALEDAAFEGSIVTCISDCRRGLDW